MKSTLLAFALLATMIGLTACAKARGRATAAAPAPRGAAPAPPRSAWAPPAITGVRPPGRTRTAAAPLKPSHRAGRFLGRSATRCTWDEAPIAEATCLPEAGNLPPDTGLTS